MDDNIKAFVRQEISPGVVLEKFQQKHENKNYYVMRIEMEIFKELDFTVDFTGSANVRIENNYGMICRTKVQPYTKVEVARLVLEKSWNIKTKFKCLLNTPSVDFQKQYIGPNILLIHGEVVKTGGLKLTGAESLSNQALKKYLSSLDSKFVDHDFLPCSTSISQSEDFTVTRFGCIVDWRRGTNSLVNTQQTSDEHALIVDKNIGFGDLSQSRVDNSSILSTLAALTSMPKLLKRVFLTDKINPTGFYKILLNDQARWITSIIDDYIPCAPKDQCLFVNNTTNALWPNLLLKAFAKKYGNYDCLTIGSSKNAFIDLTGCPTFEYTLAKDFANDSSPDYVFNKLDEWKKRGFMVTVSHVEPSTDESVDKTATHTYCLATLHMSDRIIVIWDPSKTLSFFGKFKEQSEEWTDELKERIMPNFKSGYLYVTFDEFLQHFMTVTVCKTRGWHTLNLKGKFLKQTVPDSTNARKISSRWLYKLTLDKPGDVIVGVHQKHASASYWNCLNPYLDLGIGLMKVDESGCTLVHTKEYENQRDVYLEQHLSAGTYYIIPLATQIPSGDASCEIDARLGLTPELLRPIVDDTFEKLDMLNRGQLATADVNKFLSYIGKQITDVEIIDLLSGKIPKELLDEDSTTFNKDHFYHIFENTFQSLDDTEKVKLFDHLGYSKDLISVRSRVFGLSIHSKREIHLNVENAADGAIYDKLMSQLIQEKPINIITGEVLDLAAKELILCGRFFRLFNKRIRSDDLWCI